MTPNWRPTPVFPAPSHPSQPVLSRGSQWLQRPRETFTGDRGSNWKDRVDLATADPPHNHGSRPWDPPVSPRTEEPTGAVILGPCPRCPQERSSFHMSENPLLPPGLLLSGAFQKKSKQRFHLCRDAPCTGAFRRSGAQHVEDGGGVEEAVVTGLPRELAPLLSVAGVGSLGGWGRTDPPPHNRAALPSTPSSPAH